MTDRPALTEWIARYERCWRSAKSEHLQALFTPDAVYLTSPYAEPIEGLPAISQMWEAERESPDEVFSLDTEIVALEGLTGVVRALVRYGEPVTQEYRDLWIVALDDTGRCSWFEEWPFWPSQPHKA